MSDTSPPYKIVPPSHDLGGVAVPSREERMAAAADAMPVEFDDEDPHLNPTDGSEAE